MTQTNLYMDDDNLRLYIDVQPLFLDELENSKNAAAQSATKAAQSEANVKNWKNDIIDYKTGLELFYAQASDGITAAKDSAKNDLLTQKNVISNSLNTSLNSALNTIRTTGQSYVDQAQDYAEQAQTTVDNRVSTDHINQSKALSTGAVSNDSEVLQEVTNYAHSTFDRSKFTVTGSPNITPDGIASGFSSSNYIKLPNYAIACGENDAWEMEWVFETGNFSHSYSQVIINNESTANTDSGSSKGFGIYSQFDTSTPQLVIFFDEATYQGNITYTSSFVENTNYRLVLGQDSTKRYATLYNLDNNTSTCQQVLLSTLTSNIKTYWTVGGNMLIGKQISSNGVDNTIDLKGFKFSVNGVVKYSGNKTGIDTIKPDNCTASNSANITADGVFDQSLGYGYITVNDIGIDVNKPFKIEIPFTKIASTSSGSYPVGYYENSFANVYMNDGGITPKLVFNDNGTATTLGTSPTYLAVPNIGETVNFVIEYDGNQTYTISLIKSNGTVSSGTITTSLKLNSTKLFVGRATYGETTQYMKADLNKLKAWSAGGLVYQGCLKIPYTESKTGSKIVDAVYRDRVRDAYEQGYLQKYYTLDEKNGNFTLPVGDLYGMIENLRKLIIQLTS